MSRKRHALFLSNDWQHHLQQSNGKRSIDGERYWEFCSSKILFSLTPWRQWLPLVMTSELRNDLNLTSTGKAHYYQSAHGFPPDGFRVSYSLLNHCRARFCVAPHYLRFLVVCIIQKCPQIPYFIVLSSLHVTLQPWSQKWTRWCYIVHRDRWRYVHKKVNKIFFLEINWEMHCESVMIIEFCQFCWFYSSARCFFHAYWIMETHAHILRNTLTHYAILKICFISENCLWCVATGTWKSRLCNWQGLLPNNNWYDSRL